MSANPQRIAHARASLDGLSVGDALGQVYSYRYQEARERLRRGILPPRPWWYTDDTALALAIYEHLAERGEVDQDALALGMAVHFNRDPGRGYGKMARMILQRISSGEHWRQVSQQAFSGGSMGNGAAMRVAPLGAFFSDNLTRTVEQAQASAEITHSHPEGIAGAIAVAVASAMATRCRGVPVESARAQVCETVLELTPSGDTLRVIRTAMGYACHELPEVVAREVGNGSLVISADTVPFCIWNACRCLGNYEEAIISTVEVGGDCDTNCAIVGGIVAAFTGNEGIPQPWLVARESLDAKTK